MDDVVHVGFGVDASSLVPFLVAASSVLATARTPESVQLHVVLTGGLSRARFDHLLSACMPKSSRAAAVVPWSDPPAFALKQSGRPAWAQDANPAEYARFHVEELFPSLTRLIWLDNDLVVTRPIEGLWRTSLRGTLLGMSADCSRNSFRRFVFTRRKVEGLPYNLTHPEVVSAPNRCAGCTCAVWSELKRRGLPPT